MLLYNKSDFSFGANMVGFCRDSHIYYSTYFVVKLQMILHKTRDCTQEC